MHPLVPALFVAPDASFLPMPPLAPFLLHSHSIPSFLVTIKSPPPLRRSKLVFTTNKTDRQTKMDGKTSKQSPSVRTIHRIYR